jgi:HEAT repeat protein
MSSEYFEKFYEEFQDVTFGSIRNGLDLVALSKFTLEEKERMEEILIAALGTSLDVSSRPVIALGFLKSKRASEFLKKRLTDSSGSDKVETSLALYRIEHFSDAEKIITDILVTTPKSCQWDRMIAVLSLGEMDKTKSILKTLLRSLEDEDGLIVSGTATALKKLIGDNDRTVLLINEIILLNSGHHILMVEDKTYKEKILELTDIIQAIPS